MSSRLRIPATRPPSLVTTSRRVPAAAILVIASSSGVSSPTACTGVVMTSDIEYITASGPYAELHVGKKQFIVRERMHHLENRLDPAMFIRVHRSAIVRVDRIDALLRRPGGDYAVRLKDGTEVPVSRGRRDELQERLGVE